MKKLVTALILCLSFLAPPSQTQAINERVMSLSGYLSDKSNQLIQGRYQFKISLWNNSRQGKGESAAWEEIHQIDFPDFNIGFFQIKIGNVTPISSSQIETHPYVQIEIKSANGDFELLDPDAENVEIDRVLFQADSILFKDNTFTIQTTNSLNPETTINFGENLNEFLKYNQNQDLFILSGNLLVEGNLSIAGEIDNSTIAKIITAINDSDTKIAAKNIDFGDLGMEQIIKVDITPDQIESIQSDNEGGKLTLGQSGLTLKNDLSRIWAKYSATQDLFADGPTDAIYSAADKLIYVASRNRNRIYAIDPDSKKIVQEIGTQGSGNGGVALLNKIAITQDGLMLAASSNNYFISVWKRNALTEKWQFAFDLGTPGKYENTSDGSMFWGTPQVTIRNSDKHIFVGGIYGLSKDFDPNSSGFGGIAEFDSNGKFLDIPLHIGSKGKTGQISEGEARRILDLTFDKDENLWTSSLDNQIGKFSTNWQLLKTLLNNQTGENILNQPYRILILDEKNLLVAKNTNRSTLQVWDLDHNSLLGSFGDNQNLNNTSPLAMITPTGIAQGRDNNILITDLDGKSIHELNTDIFTANSRAILKKINLPEGIKTIAITSKRNGPKSINALKIQYRFEDRTDWQTAIENEKIFAHDQKEIQLSIVYKPQILPGENLNSDTIENIMLKYIY